MLPRDRTIARWGWLSLTTLSRLGLFLLLSLNNLRGVNYSSAVWLIKMIIHALTCANTCSIVLIFGSNNCSMRVVRKHPIQHSLPFYYLIFDCPGWVLSVFFFICFFTESFTFRWSRSIPSTVCLGYDWRIYEAGKFASNYGTSSSKSWSFYVFETFTALLWSPVFSA